MQIEHVKVDYSDRPTVTVTSSSSFRPFNIEMDTNCSKQKIKASIRDTVTQIADLCKAMKPIPAQHFLAVKLLYHDHTVCLGQCCLCQEMLLFCCDIMLMQCSPMVGSHHSLVNAKKLAHKSLQSAASFTPSGRLQPDIILFNSQ